MLTAEFTHTGNKDILRFAFQDSYFNGNVNSVSELMIALRGEDIQLVVQDHPLNKTYYNLKIYL